MHAHGQAIEWDGSTCSRREVVSSDESGLRVGLAQLLDWKEAGAMDVFTPSTMLLMAGGVALCVWMLG